ncbi:TetR family transcriptional regulator [Gracilibacillus salitolerans]|uniref:TetR family transcriptional regulator n=1 Tax=Gracilibacillus salitolerans TaxID=2663022 RepID=A0A5Q2TIF7_9BACI|nr:TetR family transcriptional regulator [Gracilibacillus salitolerans]QGH33812.1 TetR family transcriptional regulator [Gracilibacillus salitolerans]
MPNETFFNLPKEKKQKLLDALHREFTKSPLASASIAKIIEYAEIPRGSFYQYFTDKEDAYFYIFNQQTSLAMEKFICILQSNNGNLFDTCIEFYRLIVEEQEQFTFFRNALLNMNYKIEESLSGIFASKEKIDHFHQIQEQLDLASLKVDKEEDLFQLMKMISAITFHNIIEKFSKDFPLEDAIHNYQTQLQFIKHGVLQQEICYNNYTIS